MARKGFSILSQKISIAKWLVLFLYVMAVPGTGFSQPVECAEDPLNALNSANCGFDSSIDGWSVIWGINATPNLVEGIPTPGSFQVGSVIQGEDGDMATTIRSPCVPISPSTAYKIQSQFKLTDPLVRAYCGYNVTGYSGDHCTGPRTEGLDEDEEDETIVFGSEWTSGLTGVLSRPTDSSMDIQVWCYIENPDDPPFTLLMDNFIASAIPHTEPQAQFEEYWENATARSYSPEDFFLPADAGIWWIGDTVYGFPECGKTPHRAIISTVNGSQALTVVSEDSNSACADNIWVAIEEFPALNINPGFAKPITRDTVISFNETGFLVDPQSWDTCIHPPCGDTISLVLEILPSVSGLAYILQRAPDAEPNTRHSFYREIFLDPDAGIYRRNLLNDLMTIPNFDPSGAQVVAISLEVNEHGSATLDNLAIGDNLPAPAGINAGHAGAWFNPETSGQGQLIDVEPEDQFMFVSWFTFTDDASEHPFEQHWFTAQGNYSESMAELTLHETLGGRFDDHQGVSTVPVGSATVRFSGCGLGRMDYSIDTWNLQGSFQMRRAIPGSENVCQERAGITTEPLDPNDGWDGAWYDEETPGQGFLIDAHPNSEGDDFIFVAWFTYGDDTATGQRWLTAQGPLVESKADLVVYETTGGSFDDPQEVETVNVGTMTIDFVDCETAELSYTLDEGLEGIIHITRVVPGGQAQCEQIFGLE